MAASAKLSSQPLNMLMAEIGKCRDLRRPAIRVDFRCSVAIMRPKVLGGIEGMYRAIPVFQVRTALPVKAIDVFAPTSLTVRAEKPVALPCIVVENKWITDVYIGCYGHEDNIYDDVLKIGREIFLSKNNARLRHQPHHLGGGHGLDVAGLVVDQQVLQAARGRTGRCCDSKDHRA